MTNQMIVFMKRCELMDAGIIGTTGRSVTIETEEGTKVLEEPEEIYTVLEWNKKGFQVMKGETHIAECVIWKKDKGGRNAENPEESEEETENTRQRNSRNGRRRKNNGFYLGKAYFFKASQVKPKE